MSSSPLRPPRPAAWLLALCPLGDRRADVEADLLELFQRRAVASGVRVARRRYYRDVLSVWRRDPRPPSVPRRESFLATVAQDLLYATRLFRRHPLLVAVVVSGLAIGTGIATTAFTYLNAGLNRDLGIRDPEAVFRVLQMYAKSSSGQWPLADATALIGRPTLSTLALSVSGGGATLGPTAAGEPSMGFIELTGPGFFPLMGGHTAIGRTLGPADDAPADVPPIVLGHAYWSRRMGEDPGAVGTVLWLNGIRVLVVGVMDRGFNGPRESPVSAWAPLAVYSRLYGESPPVATVHARLASPADATRAEAELTSLTRGMTGLPMQDGNSPTVESARLRMEGRPVWNDREIPKIWMMVLVVGGVIGLILLLACANATNLLLASALSRRREIGVRLALGASRGRMIRQLITESVLLSAVSAALGLLVASWLVPFISTLGSPEPGLNPTLDLRVYAFVVAMVFAVGIGAGLAPARHGTRGDVMTPLKSESGGATGGTRVGRLRTLLVGGQAAASCFLLVVAALLAHAALYAAHLDLGIPVDRLLVASPGFNKTYRDRARAAEYWTVAQARVAAMPGVERVARAESTPFGGVRGVVRPDGRSVNYYRVTPEYLDVLGVRLRRGRSITEGDLATRAPVAVISENIARDFWPGEEAIGSTLARLDPRAADVQIVGVAADVVSQRLREPDAGSVYRPLDDPLEAQLVVRTSGASTESIAAINDALRAIDPALRPQVTTVVSRVDIELGDVRSAAMIGLATGGTALALAIAGLFGVTAFVVSQRTREISVRMAIGATSGDVLSLLLRQSLRPVLVGLAIGLGGAALASQVLDAMLGGVSVHDPVSFVAAPLALLVAAGAAVTLPARRAARIDPAPILRE